MTTSVALHTTLVVIAIAILGSHAAADPGSRQMTGVAQAYFDRGSQAYARGEYGEAIAELERGQRLEGHPDFLYALAQAYRKQGDCSRAVGLYKAFLATHPPDQEAGLAERNLARCPSPSEPRAWYADPVGDALAAAGLIGVGVGAGYLIAGDRDIAAANRAAAAGMGAEYLRRGADGSHERRIGTWVVGGSAVLALAAIARYVVFRPADRAASTIAVIPQAGGGVVSWGARF